MKIEKIYFDLDGVLADFDRGVRELCGMDPVDQSNKNLGDDDRLFEAIRNVGHFYNKLEFCPGAKEMFLLLHKKYSGSCEILSGIPKPRRGIDTAADDKIEWVHRNLGEHIKVNIVYREEKKNYVTGRGCILIDDYEKNIREWENAGGTSISFISAKDTLDKFNEIESSKG